ncbi:PREDICTED: microtubule-associated protein 9-like isoform X2 [Populus euphratica]|uniref:Microtubule-associated protein 9-like isoform X2 n=1 Tax=Populus euphratica TaxID=75702 RepID=A0AAJ6UNL6_POPEU|nr:PREDICTED: microtubule-associated protein 9-like isoform X2 [Populus euphratica]
MSADFNVICGLYEAEAASQKDTSVDCNGDKNDDCPVNAGADQVGELKGDGVESESKTGVRDDQENIQAAEEEREEKPVEILEDPDVEGNKQELINHDELSNAVAESQEYQSTSVDVAESEQNRSSNDEEESQFNLSIDVKGHEDSQAVVIDVVHNYLGLDMDQQSDPVELNNTDDVAGSEPNQSRNDDKKTEESKLGSKDYQTVVSKGLHNSLDLYRENKPKELTNGDDFTESKPKPTSNDGEKVGLEEKSKLDSVILLEEDKFSQPVVINGIHNNLDLNQEKEPSELINDVPLKDSGDASGDSLEQNSETAPVVADEILEAESDEGLLSDGNIDGLSAGHAQVTVAETQVVDSLVDAKQNLSESSSENVELRATSDAETSKSFPIASDNGTSGDATNHVLKDTVQSEVLAANGLDIHEKGLLVNLESASQTVLVNDFVNASQMTPEHNHTLEISMEVSSDDVASVKSCESFPISPSNDDMVAELAVGINDSLSVEDTKLCDIGRTETEVDSLHADDSGITVVDAKVEAGVDNDPAYDVKPDIGTISPFIEPEEKASLSSPANDVKPDMGTVSHSIEPEEKVSLSSPANDVKPDIETVSHSIQPEEKIDIAAAEVGKGALKVDVVAEVSKGAFYVTKFPRYDENNKEKVVKHAKFQVEKSSKRRDAIQPQTQMKKFGDQNNQTAKTKRHAKPAALENGSLTVGGRFWIEEPRQDENKRIKAEEELARKARQDENKRIKAEEKLARKAEELRKEKEAAMLKEQRRLEENAKAKEAMERKKRMADRAQARAALRAQREAEQKEKEREKKARKKERKKAAIEDTKDIDEIESSPSSETLTEMEESERTEKPVTNRPQKPSEFAKQNKYKSMPLPLRNRGKRKRQTWMWALLSLLLVIALFFVGNSGFFHAVLQRSGI